MTGFHQPDSAKAWLTLYAILEQSQQAMLALLECFSSPEAALAASSASWRQTGAVPLAKLVRFERWQAGQDGESDALVAATQAWLAEAGDRHLLTLGDPAYPRLLQTIADPPPLLFVRGDPAFLSLPQIAIVGSRHPSRAGEELARDFSRELVQRGLAITSGLALGIDAAAHAGALAGGGTTIAVLGTGPDRLYPRSNITLAGQVLAAGGLVVSEYLPGTAALPHHFPRRNRIISGLSLGVLVVEAALQSGSLITARLAAEQGREVWAMPGSVHNPQTKGCHTLIREGAKLVEEAAHVLEDIGPLLGVLRQDMREPVPAVNAPRPRGPAAKVLKALGWECRSLDWLVDSTGLPPGELSALLMQMELDGQVATVPGGYERLPA